ncbi:MAG: GNAT family N-acetyltransferase [Bacteriovoracaceae bacterium]
MLDLSAFNINSKDKLQEFFDFYLNRTKSNPAKIKWQLSDQNSFIGKIKYKIFTVKKENKIAGTAISFINPKLKETGQFGFLEFIEDIEIFKTLIRGIETFFKENDIKYYLGPINFSTWDNYRIKVDQFDIRPYLFEPTNPSYYAKFFEAENFNVAKSYITRELIHISETNAKLEKRYMQLKEQNITIEKFNLNNFEQEMPILHTFVKQNFNTNFLYTDIEFNEFYQIYNSMKNIINPNLFLIARNKENKIVGFIFGMEDLLNKDQPCAILKTLAVDEKYRNLGLGAALMFKIHQEVSKLGITRIKHALMAEDNLSTHFSQSNDTIFTYKLFGKKI